MNRSVCESVVPSPLLTRSAESDIQMLQQQTTMSLPPRKQNQIERPEKLQTWILDCYLRLRGDRDDMRLQMSKSYEHERNCKKLSFVA